MTRLSRSELASKMNDVYRDILSFASAGNKPKIRDDSFMMLEMAESLYKDGRIARAEYATIQKLHDEVLQELESVGQKLSQFIQFSDRINIESRKYS